MDSPLITSRHNALVKHARAVRDRRETEEQIFIEGLRLSEEALRSRLVIQDVIYTEKFQNEERGARLLEGLKADGCRLSLVSEEVLASISDTRTPQGIVLLATRPRTGRAALLSGSKIQENSPAQSSGALDINLPLVVVLHGINNPSNAGAILRTAEAAGATGIIYTRGTTDIFSPKALRGSMGSNFRLPSWAGASFAEVISWCKQNGLRTVGAALGASRDYTETDWTNATALVVASEANGLMESEVYMLDETVRIPMRPEVESLNVAVASGIILYEAYRQRREGRSQNAE